MIDVGKLYKENRKVIFDLVLKNSGNIDEAADILQDGVIVLWNNSKKADFTLTASVNTYLYSICRNLWLSKLRKKGKTTSLNVLPDVVEQGDQINELLEKEQQFKLLEKSILQLGETCQQILKLFYFEKLLRSVLFGQLISMLLKL